MPGTGTDTQLLSVQITASDSGTGADDATLAVSIVRFETGVATEVAGINKTIVVTDSGQGIEPNVGRIGIVVQDSGHGGSGARTFITVSDSGGGREASAKPGPLGLFRRKDGTRLAASIPAPEAGTGLDSQIANQSPAFVGFDQGQALEDQVVSAAITTTDTGQATEVTDSSTPVTATDSGSATEATSIAASVTSADTGQGQDFSSQGDQVFVLSDSGTATETVSRVIVVTDTGQGADTTGGGGVTDSGVGTDFAFVNKSIVVADVGHGDDDQEAIWDLPEAPEDFLFLTPLTDPSHLSLSRPASIHLGWGTTATYLVDVEDQDVGTSFEKTILLQFPDWQQPENGVGSDAQVLRALFSDSDAGMGSETETLQSAGTTRATEAGVGADAASVAVRVTSSDAGVGSDLAFLGQGDASALAVDTGALVDAGTLRALILVTDQGAASETVSLVKGPTAGTVSVFWPVTGSFVQDGADGALTNPTNVSADDSNYATSSVSFAQVKGERYGNFGLNSLIPSGVGITRVVVEYECRVISPSPTGEFTAEIYVSGASVGGPRIFTPTTTVETLVQLDVTSARAWTRADLLNGVFAVALRTTDIGQFGHTLVFDYLKVTVDYA